MANGEQDRNGKGADGRSDGQLAMTAATALSDRAADKPLNGSSHDRPIAARQSQWPAAPATDTTRRRRLRRVSRDADAQPMLVLQHIGCEPPAAYEEELTARGLALDRVRLDRGEALPDWRAYSGIVAMGGPMGAYDDELYRWLAPEKRLIADAVRAGKPYWGVCLGAQLLAASLGASVTPGVAPEVGVFPVELADAAADDPVFCAAPAEFQAFHWHGDTYALPHGAMQLARSEQYEQQAFVYEHAYALQFHLEVNAALVQEWRDVPAYAESLERLPAGPPKPPLAEQVAATQEACIELARGLFGRWLTHVVAGAPLVV